MRDIVRAYIKKFKLLTDDRPVLVGVSGGADSIALLTLLVESGYSCIAAHCNFHLRGDESLRDEEFTKEYAGRLGIPFLKVDFDTQLWAETHHVSIEMAARELRYEWFEEQRSLTGAQAVAVAHHRDDSVETVLLNLIRGTGIRGMSGIRPRNGFVVRPLLAVSREAILDWLAERGLPFMTDSTNQSDVYTRNFLRLRVLPLLEEINPSVKAAIARTSEHLAAVETVYQSVVEEVGREVVEAEGRLSIPALMRYPAPETLLYELLKAYDFTPSVVADIYLSLSKEAGKIFFSPTHRLIKDRTCLLVSPLREEKERTEYRLSSDEGRWSGPIGLSFEKIELNEDFLMRKDWNIGYFDYDKLTFPLVLRKWKRGDWFVPFGMKGRKKLSDYFSDRKFSLLEKEQVWLLCSGDAVIWVVGERPDNRFCLDKTTKRVLVVNFFPEKGGNK